MGGGRSLRWHIRSVISPASVAASWARFRSWDLLEDRDGSHEPDARTSDEKALSVARGDME
jgi:hypothetical protein